MDTNKKIKLKLRVKGDACVEQHYAGGMPVVIWGQNKDVPEIELDSLSQLLFNVAACYIVANSYPHATPDSDSKAIAANLNKESETRRLIGDLDKFVSNWK